MTLRIRHIDPDATPSSSLVSLETLARVVPNSTVAEVVTECGATEQRTRKLSATFRVVFFCIAMNLYATDCLAHVFFRLVSQLRWLWPDPAEASRVSKGALSQARYRLGARPLVALFKRVCTRPLAEPATPGAFLFGLRLMALDGTILDVPDIPQNVRAFGKPGSWRGTSAWAQVRVVAISECATHAICDAGVWRHDFDERAAGRRLLRSVGEGTLVLWDRGFHSFDMVQAALARGSELLGRLPATVKPKVHRTLSDGTQLVWLQPAADYQRCKRGERIVVRLIRYTLVDDPDLPGHGVEHRLITSLVDPEHAGAEELVMAYHYSRWEFELAVDEMKSHQRAPQEPLRSKKPVVGVIQEIYGLFIAHYVVRAVMVEAARTKELSPSRLSFTGTLRLIREMIPQAQCTAPADHPRLYGQLLADIAATPLRPRTNRTNPRVVKRKMSKFRVKNPEQHHRHRPQPTKPFREAVVLLN